MNGLALGDQECSGIENANNPSFEVVRLPNFSLILLPGNKGGYKSAGGVAKDDNFLAFFLNNLSLIKTASLAG